MSDLGARRARILLEAVIDFQRATSKQDLWERLNARLAMFGITGLIYGTEAMPDPARPLSLMLNSIQGTRKGAWLKDKFDEELFYCDEYVTAPRCGERAPILWSDTSRLVSVSNQALLSLAIDYDHLIITGVTIPMQFAGKFGLSSIGCHAGGASFAEFDRTWAEYSDVIIGIVNAFDVQLRNGFNVELFALDARETEFLQRILDGKPLKRIADAMVMTDRQIESLTVSVRRKLHATTLPQAISTAIIFNLIAL